MVDVQKIPQTIHIPPEIENKVSPRQKNVIRAYNHGGISTVRAKFGYGSDQEAADKVFVIMKHIAAMGRVGEIDDPEENLRSPDVSKPLPRPKADNVSPARKKSVMAIFDEVLQTVSSECALPENEVATFMQRSSHDISSAASICMYLACQKYEVPIDRVAKQFRCDEDRVRKKIKSIEFLIKREDSQVVEQLERIKRRVNIWL